MAPEISRWIQDARDTLIKISLEKFSHAATLPELRTRAYSALGCFGRHLEAEQEGLFDILDYPEIDKPFSEIKTEFIEDITQYLKLKIK